MAQSNKTDELFSSRLEGLEMMPSEAAWGQVQSGLNKGKAKWFIPIMSTAAAVALLIVGAIIIFKSEDTTKNYLTGINDHPPYEKIEISHIAVPELKTQDFKAKKSRTLQFVAQGASTPTDIPQKETTDLIEIFAPDTKSITMEIAELRTPEIIAPHSSNSANKTTLAPIKITYIAKSESSESEPIVGKINRVMEVAKHTSPAELLADLREAKSNLLRRN
ncbi:MAG: hypothetical protein ABJ004_08500 [Cyclobacteriaceae bacterium]